MTAASLLRPISDNGLQPVDLSRHLGGIAELLELCFGAELDAMGRGLIREMRWLSRTGPALRLLQVLLIGRQPLHLGYVWVEAGRVVGTVSTQRAAAGANIWLVANVAVHPDFRRRGIAAALMRATLDLIRSQRGAEAILQVDDDNLSAVALYRGLGFAHVVTQTTWVRGAQRPPPPYEPSAFDVRLAGRHEWAQAYALAQRVRPEGLVWGRPLHRDDFRPGLWRRLDQFFTGRSDEHWLAAAPRRIAAGRPWLAGSLIVSANAPEGDRLALLVQPEYRGQVERPLLLRGLRRLGRRPGPLRVDHDADDQAAAGVLSELGFHPQRTLRWMRRALR